MRYHSGMGYTEWSLTAVTSQWLDFVLKQKNVPQAISTSYADDEQTGAVLSRGKFTNYMELNICEQFRLASQNASVPGSRSLVRLHLHLWLHALILYARISQVPVECL